ncbi:MAG TPA: glutaredoxin family protein [Geobacteraceae bacterium]|nr:glutaredoxin family protein [Geobacteraceae bacterium]
MNLLCGAVLILSVILVESAMGNFYSYTDSKGEIHFVDDIDKVPKKYRNQLKNADPQGSVNVMDTSRPARFRSAQDDPPKKPKASTSSVKVEVFMTSWCGYCRKMINFLNEKGIPYTAYDIEKDNAAAATYRSLGGRGVPLVRVGSHLVRGYDPAAVMSYYNSGN